MESRGMRKAVEQETLQTLVETGAAREFRVLRKARAGAWSFDWVPSGCPCALGASQ